MKTTISLESLISRTLKFSRLQSRAPFTLLLGLVAAAALWAMPETARGQIFVSSYTNGTVSEYNLDGTTAHAPLITGLNTPFGLALSGNNLYVVNQGNGTVGVYNATTGAAINPSLVTGLSQNPYVLALSGSNLYVVSSGGTDFAGVVGLYNATTGIAINPSLVTGVSFPTGIAISGNNLYVPSQRNLTYGYINEYNATTGTAISVPLVSGLLHAPEGLLVSGNILYEANATAGTIGEYNATTGAVIDASFISGLSTAGALQLALLGNNLFVSESGSGTIGEYDATTGATINASLISGLSGNFGLVVDVPDAASTWTLLLLAIVPLFGMNLLLHRRTQKHLNI